MESEWEKMEGANPYPKVISSFTLLLLRRRGQGRIRGIYARSKGVERHLSQQVYNQGREARSNDDRREMKM